MKSWQHYCAITFTTMVVISSANATTPHDKRSTGAPVLWHGIRAGMTEAQARTVLPGLTKNDRNNDFHAPPTQVAGEGFDVGIEMVDGRVGRVSLTSSQALPEEAKQAIESKFGAATKPYECSMGAFYRCEGEWRTPGGVTVSLINLTLTGMSSTEIRYEAPDTSGL